MVYNNKEVLNEILSVFNDLNILSDMILIGSWAEMFYELEFRGYISTMKTMDIDFYIPVIKKNKNPIDLVSILDDEGFFYDEDLLTQKSKFYGKAGYEIEFLANICKLQTSTTPIRHLNINAECLPYLDIIQHNVMNVKINNSDIEFYIPTPGAYIIHKLIINNDRKDDKKIKDIEAILNLLPHVKSNESWFSELKAIYDSLNSKRKNMIKRTCDEYEIDLFEVIEI
jgi:hypothetical protein